MMRLDDSSDEEHGDVRKEFLSTEILGSTRPMSQRSSEKLLTTERDRKFSVVLETLGKTEFRSSMTTNLRNIMRRQEKDYLTSSSR